jgi:hypothetical protein
MCGFLMPYLGTQFLFQELNSRLRSFLQTYELNNPNQRQLIYYQKNKFAFRMQ